MQPEKPQPRSEKVVPSRKSPRKRENVPGWLDDTTLPRRIAPASWVCTEAVDETDLVQQALGLIPRRLLPMKVEDWRTRLRRSPPKFGLKVRG